MARSKHSAEKYDFWKLVFQEYRGSGLSIRAFCEREGLAQPSFYAWRKRLSVSEAVDLESGTDDIAQIEKLIPVRIVTESRSQHSQSQTSVQLEIRTPRGYTLRLDENVEVNRLSELLLVIASVPGEAASC